MDAELDADSARRKMEAAGEALEIVPLEMYDSARAKIAANMRWLFAKAFGIDYIPEDLRDPFYTDQYDQEHIKPPVIRLLLSCELYCRVCGLILKGDQVASLQSHQSVIQALSRKGIYVIEGDDTPVSDSDLTCQPIKMSSHIPMIDALMMAYTVEMISIEKAVTCVKRFSTFSASKELPFDLEDAMVFWINKVNLKMREITEKEHKSKQHLLESPSHQKVRYRRDHASGRQLPYFPLLEDLIRDVCDCAALLTVVHYYCPDLMKLDDICLKEVTSIADSLYNIQLLKEFANEYLNKSFYLTLEDMLYAPPVLKHNVMVFIAELFWWFEIVKPEFVQPRDVQEFKDGEEPKSARPTVPISNATKRSFLVSPGGADPALPVQNSPDVWSDVATVETIEEQDAELTKELHPDKKQFYEEDEESAKLQEDMNVKEHKDKDGGSRCSSPGQSQVSSVASSSVRMTSFAERKMQKFGSNQDIRSSTSSSQRTTPDGSESCPLPLTSWRMKRDQSPTPQNKDSANMLASELVQLHMQLEEKRRAIESQKKKMEVLTARQRLKLGKAAFLHIVKKGKSDTLPQPTKSEYYLKDCQKLNQEKEKSSKDDTCVGALRDGLKEAEEPEKASLKWAGGGTVSPSALDMDEEMDLNECNHSIELLNEAIGNIQQQMMQLSLQQEMLMKQNLQSPTGAAPPPSSDQSNASEPRVRASIHFVEPSGSPVVRKSPKLSSARSRSKPSELLLVKEHGKGHKSSTPTPTDSPSAKSIQGGRTPKPEYFVQNSTRSDSFNKGNSKSTTFHLNDEANLRMVSREPSSVALGVTFEESMSTTLQDVEATFDDEPAMDNVSSEDISRGKVNLIEVDLSDLAANPDEENANVLDVTTDGSDGEKKSGMGFFFKDEQKAEDELAKKRAAFLLKQQRKAEEARLRKQQLEAESEMKRDEARRKAEEERIRKEEEKARRELIKQGYLRRKQQEMCEEQEQPQPKPKPKSKPKKQRPKSVLKEENSVDTLPRCPATSNTLMLLFVLSINRGESVESFSGLSRNSSRTTERDWDNGSTASSITSTSMAEYTGPKLFKEPSAKSNKPIIHNAIAHCCLAGKVNEPQKNSILEELEKCESNHLMILFRDSGCQFRALYCYFPDTEEIHKLTGTGPKSITKKMIDKLYKYSSDRKQFTVIPAKTVSVSVDALTIHNHLWQAKRLAGPKKSAK
uniref:Calmodulin-regulated spectrin-associated protein 1-B-like n=1 Tax=Sinocyclocheilus anshuiensis TaxID=1608454 RepID=A0A671MAH9_9TELE